MVYPVSMAILRGKVQGGRIIVDENLDLPEGSEVQLQVVESDEDLDEEDRARLNAAIERAQAEIDRGEGVRAEDVVASLWRVHGR